MLKYKCIVPKINTTNCKIEGLESEPEIQACQKCSYLVIAQCDRTMSLAAGYTYGIKNLNSDNLC